MHFSYSNMRRLYVLLLVLVTIDVVVAQQLSVVGFDELTQDISARSQQRLDLNGDPCALIKVQIPGLSDVVFDGWVIDQNYTPGEYRVYVPGGTKKIIIKHQNFLPLEYRFPTKIQSNVTYKMTLKVPIHNDGSSIAQIKTNVLKATLRIADKSYDTENAQFTIPIKPGKYNINITAQESGFSPYEDEITIESEKPFHEFVCNLSTQTQYNVLFSAEKGTEITVDGNVLKNIKKNTFTVSSGIHTVNLKLVSNPKWQKQVTINGLTKDIIADFSLRSKVSFSSPLGATFKISPLDDALKPTKKSIVTGEVVNLLGDYEITVSKDGYKSSVIRVSVHPTDSLTNLKANIDCKADELDRQYKYDKAITYYEKMAASHDEHALYKAGEYYYYGRGVQKDQTKAIKYWKLAANLGNEDAILNLAKGHLSLSEKIKYLTTIAEKGNVQAQLQLANIYLKEQYKPDYEKALMYYQKTVKYYPKNNFVLGEFYRNGWGVSKNIQLAKQYYESGSFIGDENCKEKLADFLYENGEIDKACNEYLNILHLSSANRVRLADWYYHKGDYYVAGNHLLKVNTIEVENSLYLQNFYSDLADKLIKSNKTMACNLYEIAVDKFGFKYGETFYALGTHYETTHNYDKAFHYYTEGAKMEHAKSITKLGYCYEDGRGTNKDIQKAINLYKKGIQLGDMRAYRLLGTIYVNGDGGVKDEQTGVDYWIIAAEADDKRAINLLIKYYTFKRNDTEVERWKSRL